MSEGRPRSYFQLIRFPLIFTVWSDVLLGYFLVSAESTVPYHWGGAAVMLGVTAFLFGGGMTLFDCFEYSADIEHGRPRMLPVGVMSLHGTFAVGVVLTLTAIGAATMTVPAAGLVSVLVALLLLVFGSVTRGMPFLGSINIALVRAANVVLGMAFAHRGGALVPHMEYWGPVAAVFGVVFLVAEIASEEAHARRERLLRLTGAVIVLLAAFNVLLYVPKLSTAKLTDCIALSVFVLATILRLGYLARRAVREMSAESIQKLAVAGLVGVIVLNANFIAFAGELMPTLGILFLLVPTFLMLRFFHMLYPGTRTAMD